MTNLLVKAKKIASHHHRFQTHRGGKPYTVHLEDVSFVLTRYHQPYILIVCAWLHDLLEDTTYSRNQMTHDFGPFITDIVWAVTDEPGETRKERKLATYPKIKNNKSALILKLADRIANLEACIIDQNAGLLKMYKKEYTVFKQHLFDKNSDEVTLKIWNDLDKLQNIK